MSSLQSRPEKCETNVCSIIVIDFSGHKDKRKINTIFFIRKSVSPQKPECSFLIDIFFLLLLIFLLLLFLS